MNQSEIKGLSTELLVQNAFINENINISIPVSPYCIYDLVAEINTKFYKVQIKSGIKSKTGIRIDLTSSHLSANGAVRKKYTKNEIDFICTYYNHECYLIPFFELENRAECTLSLNNKWVNAHHLMLADDYLLRKQVNRLVNNGIIYHKIDYKIQQFDLQGNFIAEYNKLSETPCYKKDKRCLSHLSACINGKQKTAYGYIWKRIEIR